MKTISIIILSVWAIAACTNASQTNLIKLVSNSKTVKPISVIPLPMEITHSPGTFTLTRGTVIQTDKKTRSTGDFLAGILEPATGYRLKVLKRKSSGNSIIKLNIDKNLNKLGKEGYTLSVATNQITISSIDSAGVFYGCQTLRQLLPYEIFSDSIVSGINWTVACVNIKDSPRFVWRGMMLDVARHFFPKEDVKKFLDYLAMYKMNRFHWHLTEDQGWRIEIKKYPKLTKIGGWRKETIIGHLNDKPKKYDGKRYGGFYSQDDVREIVDYAKKLHINVVPEIEMPGHESAAIAAYPEIGCTKKPIEVATRWGIHPNLFNVDESTFDFLEDVLTEVMELFPDEYIHVGGDEARKNQWKSNSNVQKRMKELGIKNEHELQSYFITRIEKFLNKHGKRLIGWDEILEGGLAPNATVMSWRGIKGGIAAAQAGHDVVMSPGTHCYFDHYQTKDKKSVPLAIGGYTSLEKVYSYEPVPEKISKDKHKHILGAQANVWTEYIPNFETVELRIFPRICALSEVNWSPAKKRNWTDFKKRIKSNRKRLDMKKVNYYKTP